MTLPAVRQEIACSELRPPNTTAIRILLIDPPLLTWVECRGQRPYTAFIRLRPDRHLRGRSSDRFGDRPDLRAPPRTARQRGRCPRRPARRRPSAGAWS